MLVSFIAAACLFIVAIAVWKAAPGTLGPDGAGDDLSAPGLERSDSADDLRTWLSHGDARRDAYYGGFGGFGGDIAVRTMAAAEAPVAMPAEDVAQSGNDQGMESAPGGVITDGDEKTVDGPGRVSGTNVQTLGIDEPDILKTDGERLFFSPQMYWGWPPFFDIMPAPEVRADEEAATGSGSSGTTSAAMPLVAIDGVADERMMAPDMYPDYVLPKTKVVDAFPVEDLALAAEIDRTGELLLSGDMLMVFAYDGLYAYDMSGEKPTESWSHAYGQNQELVTARLRGDEVYLVLRAGIDRGVPCPLLPFKDAATITVPCGDIWHPIAPVPSDVTYAIMNLDAATGAVNASTAFVGSWSSTVYMSTDDIYVSWEVPTDTLDIMTAFVQEESGVFPAEVQSAIGRISSISISRRAKLVELQVIIEEWMSGLDQDEQLRVATELQNRTDAFTERHQRDFHRSGIVRIEADGLAVAADGSVPGSLLNQFSMDAYEGHLRVATTVGGRGAFGWQFGFGGNDNTVNDVYVLDGDLEQTGSVLDLGKGERVYSARFVGDEGYVVTFKQIDPFYVLDLSDPAAPMLSGELKIPGYSSYLHPITDDVILGIGQEEGQVKLSLFDVSNPSTPTELAKYNLDEYWSDVLNTHHAFLLDRDHGVFFLPGGKGGYIFSYADNALTLVKAVSDVQARRALYLDDYMYIVGDDRIVVLNENDWERVAELDLAEKR
jgi:uncharacterized secreted protein with C-terminal beta-propeller domain